ncbi:MAG: acetyl-CoA hydrolase/transferase C-terminal domain-containing protein [Gammaproteobacteria bacterium]
MSRTPQYQHPQYQQKLLNHHQVIAQLQGVNNLILGMGVAMPPGLIDMLAIGFRTGAIAPLNVYYMHGSERLAKQLLTLDFKDKFTPRCLFLSAHDRQALQRCHDAWIEYVPAAFHHVGRLLTENIEPDCFMVTVSPPDKHGYFSLGTNADYGASVVRKAKKVIVEVNRFMPRTFGECSVHISEITGIVENDEPLTEMVPQHATDVDWAIARQVAERIDDGDTLQIGVGGVPNAVLELLQNHQDLGLHTELFSPTIAHLIQKGVINGRRKTWMQHKHVFTLALGNRAMYDFMDDNPSLVGYPASWVNNPHIISKNRCMVSVNSAIEVDLSGQINAEQIQEHPFSGTGGQLDFVRGAYASQGGRSFIALHSTAKQGTVSRIVPKLKSGVVTDTRIDVHYIVTEHGCVELKGLSTDQRAKALISLCHPAFRDELERACR